MDQHRLFDVFRHDTATDVLGTAARFLKLLVLQWTFWALHKSILKINGDFALKRCFQCPNRPLEEELKDLVFMDRNENVMMLGSVGTGKTHLSLATGLEACKRGKNVRFFRVSDLVSILLEKHQNGSLTRFMREMKQVELLILVPNYCLT
jgi:hypothetical protein